MMKRKLYSDLRKTKEKLKEICMLSDQELQAKTAEFKQKIEEGVSTDSLLPEAFAVVCEADRRILGMMPFDCQIIGASALHHCCLAEMNTGEGKTLTATMPLYLNALTGKSTILVTANDYLAERDAEEMGPVYRFLGLTVEAGVGEKDKNEQSSEQHKNQRKKQIYAADIVYTTHGTLGFDYLFNNLVTRAEDRFMRDFYYVIIDEADSVLLDAAQMPLVISGTPRVQSNLYQMADFFVTTLEEDRDYEQEDHAVWLTDEGVRYAEKYFGIEKYYARENFEINRHVTLALQAHVLYEKDKSYVVTEENELMLLDNGTGRLLPGMKLRGGLHQAFEAKEKAKLTQDNLSVASITYQNLFLLFPRLSGMSGTIADAKKELREIYKEKVAVIPPNRPLIRVDARDRFLKTAKQQYEAAIAEVVERHNTGQPVLIVTNTINDTAEVSRLLVAESIPHSVLNANNAFWEAQIIKEAGQKGAVTVSTGMAGRGTDIKLGEGVKELGGLAVIGVGRMANIRQERQARGRAGRQGDPGFSRFYVSLEDEVVSSVGEKTLNKFVERDKKITKHKLKRLIMGAQKRGEENAVTQRKNSVDYDKVMKQQRTIIYDTRNRLLDGESLSSEMICDMICSDVKDFLNENKNCSQGDLTRYVLDHLTYNIDSEFLKISKNSGMQLEKEMQEYALKLLKKRKSNFTEEEFSEYIRLCALKAIDEAWVLEVDYLQQLQGVVSGRSSAQRNPIFEYHKEAYKSFARMKDSVRREITRNILIGEKSYDKHGAMILLTP